MKRLLSILLFGLILFPTNGSAQQFFRFRADVSVKTKLEDGTQNLSMGRVFYDRNEKKIVYLLSFPEEELLITADTVTYRIQNEEIIQRSFSPALMEFSVFHLALSSNLPDYGLKKTMYTIEQVDSENGMVISTWMPPKSLEEDLGKIIISVKDKRLFGVIFFSPDGTISRKQLFEDYILLGGLAFPGKIIEIAHSEKGESYQVMTFKNPVVDELENNQYYSYPVNDL